MTGLETFANNTIEPFVMLYNKTIELLPGIIVALVMLFIGLFLSRWISTLLRKALNAIKLDDFTAKIGVNDFLTRFGFGKSPTYAICFVISWAVMIAFIMIAADSLGLTIIRQMLLKLLAFIPYIIVSIIILFAGLLFGRFMQRLVENSAKANDIKGGVLFAKIINIIIVVFAVILALQQININFDLINYVILILLASLGLAFGLAFGLGGKAVVEEYLRDLVNNTKEEKKDKEDKKKTK
ncbi:MAG: hypothetical protein II972_04500 [Elusimicrobiaceae bacterium]|nr:hypothetical protein [Elusimicrobiaceae bacterium]